ncbi:MAG: FAD-dependent oxidoreductase, partial [Planctomycetota bacterium]
IVEGFDVNEFEQGQGGCVGVRAKQNFIEADTFVVAAGALSPFLNEHLGCRLPIQPGKGYSLTMPTSGGVPEIPMILEQHRVAITPMNDRYRIGSTMEFAGYDESINPKRLDLLRRSAEIYLKDNLSEPVIEKWFGWRPMTWDGVPVIDRSPAMKNVWIAAGHNMLGLSMAPATGKLVQELIDKDEPHLDRKRFELARLQ